MIPGSCQRTEKAMKHEGEDDINCSWYTCKGFDPDNSNVGIS